MTHAWLDADWLTFDTETSGVDTDTDRIVTAALLRVPAGATEPTRVWEWVADPGVEIPPEAAAIHGYTNDRVKREGQPSVKVIGQLVGVLAEQWTAATPLVVANAPFDLSLLDVECVRHLHRPLKLSGYVLDPMVIDRTLDKYRKGHRKLEDLCAHYGVELTDAHTAKADALAALLVMRALVEVFPEVQHRHLVELHHYQQAWRRQWADGFEAYERSRLRRTGASEEQVARVVIDRAWPVRDRAAVGVP